VEGFLEFFYSDIPIVKRLEESEEEGIINGHTKRIECFERPSYMVVRLRVWSKKTRIDRTVPLKLDEDFFSFLCCFAFKLLLECSVDAFLLNLLTVCSTLVHQEKLELVSAVRFDG
jgi:hypothetical protein